MKLPQLALFRRSIMLDSRAFSTYTFRVGLISIIFLILSGVERSSRYSRGAAIGREFFLSLTILNLVFIVLLAISFFSAAVTEEKEEQTLGLLIMTGMNPLTLLLSKSTSKLVNCIFLLISQIPFTLLAVTLGGISIKQIITVYLIEIAFMFMLANVALFFSVISPTSSRAALWTAIILFSYFFMPSLILEILDIMNFRFEGEMISFISESYAFFAVSKTLTTAFDGAYLGYSFWSNIAIGIIFFSLSWFFFNSFSRDTTESNTLQKRSLFSKNKSKWNIFKAGRVWSSPMLWKEFYFSYGGLFYLFLKISLMCFIIIWVSYEQYPHTTFLYRSFLRNSMIISFLFLLVELTVVTSRLFSLEIQGNTLQSLFLLPQSASRLILKKLGGSILFLLPSLIILSVSILFLDNAVDDILKLLDQTGFWLLITFMVFYYTLLMLISIIGKRLGLIFTIFIVFGLVLVVNILRMSEEIMLFLFFIMTIGVCYMINTKIKEAAAK